MIKLGKSVNYLEIICEQITEQNVLLLLFYNLSTIVMKPFTKPIVLYRV